MVVEGSYQFPMNSSQTSQKRRILNGEADVEQVLVVVVVVVDGADQRHSPGAKEQARVEKPYGTKTYSQTALAFLRPYERSQ